MAASLVAAKQQLRSRMRQRLAGLSHEAVVAQSHRIYEAVRDLEPYRDAARIGIFLSMPVAEVHTDAIVRHALGCGKQVFVPYLHRPSPAGPDAPARVMDMVSLAGVDDYESLRPDRWGIPSVDPVSVDARSRVLAGSVPLDLVLVPGLAFDSDAAGHIRRLGHGKGFYDLFLNRYSAEVLGLAGPVRRPPPLLYGLALTEQLLSAASGEQVPVDLHDRDLHGLILGSGQFRESPVSGHR